MTRKAICLLLILAAAGCTSIPDIKSFGVSHPAWGMCRGLSNGAIDVLVAPEKGGRIISYCPAGGTNLLWTTTDGPAYAARNGKWLNWGGEKTWIWRQDDWRKLIGRTWPPPYELDQNTFKCDWLDDTLQMTSEPVAGCGVRAIRTVRLEPEKARLYLTTRFEAVPGTQPAPTNISVWSVVQVPPPSNVYVRLTGARRFEAGMPGKPAWPAPERSGDILNFTVRPVTQDWPKAAMDADLFAFQTASGLFVISDISAWDGGGSAHPERAQMCLMASDSPAVPKGKIYLELELTSELRRSDSTGHKLSIAWELLPLPADHRETVRILKTYDGRPPFRPVTAAAMDGE